MVVSTKLDTKIPQFARASDVEVFLSPPVCVLDGFMLGDSPFFTSVPSGRVGSGHESVYRSNDEFKQVYSPDKFYVWYSVTTYLFVQSISLIVLLMSLRSIYIVCHTKCGPLICW